VWVLPLAAAPFVPLVGFLDDRACKWFAVCVSGATAALGSYAAFTFSAPQTESLQGWVGPIGVPLEVKIDGLSLLLAAFVSLLSFVIILYSAGNMSREKGQMRFYSLVLLFVGSMLGLVMAGNLVQLYFFWEIVGICSALLIAFWNDRDSARKAGFKAFAVTRFGDVSLFIAVILVLTTIHTTNLDSIAAAVSAQGMNGTWILVGLLMLIGAMGKSAQVPLHAWLPDAMEGPTPVSALIHAATMVNAGVYLVVRMFPIFASSQVLLLVVVVVGLLSTVVGAACACAADDIKRILAYSTISQLGLMFVAVGLGNWQGAIYHLISQGLFKALAFMAAGSVIEAVGTRNIEEMGGLRRTMKYTYLAFLFSVLAMVGLPPLIGFWTKDAIVSAAISSNLWAALVVVAASVLTSFYSFRALIKVFHGEPRSEARESPPLMVLPMMVLLVSVVSGWLVLSYQTLLPALEGWASLPTSLVTMFALFLGLGISYVAFAARRNAIQRIVETSSLLQRTKSFLLEGLGFDKFYSFLANLVTPLARLATAIQTGMLSINVALLLSALLVLILLLVTGVI
jgi:NADH-quinone oxidoreductase subunit L